MRSWVGGSVIRGGVRGGGGPGFDNRIAIRKGNDIVIIELSMACYEAKGTTSRAGVPVYHIKLSLEGR